MAKSVIVTYTTTSQIVVNGSQYSHYRVSLLGEVPQTQMVPFGQASAVFSSVVAGLYTARVELSHADGSMVGPGITSAPFEVIDDAMLEAPQTVTVAVGPSV